MLLYPLCIILCHRLVNVHARVGKPEIVYFPITNSKSGMALDIPAGNCDHGTHLTTWTYHGGDNQLFYFGSNDSIMSKKCNMALDVRASDCSNGENLTIWPAHGGRNQAFDVRDNGSIVNTLCGKAIDMYGSNSKGRNLNMWDYHGGWNQIWDAQPPIKLLTTASPISPMPSQMPSYVSSVLPSTHPSSKPSSVPSATASLISPMPSQMPSYVSSVLSSTHPSSKPLSVPSALPSMTPSEITSALPSSIPALPFFFSGSQQITRSTEGNPDAVVVAPPIDYSLKFTIEPKGVVDSFGSIIHFTTGGDCCEYGERVPGIWFLSGSTKLLVHTRYSLKNTRQYIKNLAINKKHDIELRVLGSVSTVYLNGVVVSEETIGSRPQLAKVDVYIGDPWHKAANAVISDISLTPFLPVPTTPVS